MRKAKAVFSTGIGGVLGLLGLSLLLLTGCGSTPRSQVISNLDLRSFDTFELRTLTSTGAISLNNAAMGGGAIGGTNNGVVAAGSSVSTTHVMPADTEIILAAQEIEFELRDRGFKSAPKGEEGDLIIQFAIGTVRNDPLAGWIADSASLQFTDRGTGQLLLVIRTEANFITPTVNSIIDELMDEFDETQE